MDKTPFPLMIAGPLPFVAMAWLKYHLTGVLEGSWLWLPLALTVVSWCLAAFLWNWKRRLIARRTFIDIRPGTVTAMEGDVVRKPFSSETQFLADYQAFDDAISSIAIRPSVSKGKFVYGRESAHVRIWPNGLALSEPDIRALVTVLRREFIDPEIEIGQDSDTSTQKDAIRA